MIHNMVGIMPRPRMHRRIAFAPDVVYFKPRGVALGELEHVQLTLEEVEALRLTDVDNLSQRECAVQMGVSQSTFFRILDMARKKMADALVHGKAIELKGGNVIMPNQDKTGPIGKGFARGGRGKGAFGGGGQGRRGIGGGPAACKCPKCGHQLAHARGTPCVQVKCPQCDTPMVRGDTI